MTVLAAGVGIDQDQLTLAVEGAQSVPRPRLRNRRPHPHRLESNRTCTLIRLSAPLFFTISTRRAPGTGEKTSLRVLHERSRIHHGSLLTEWLREIEIWAGINGEKEIYLALYIFVSVILIRHDGSGRPSECRARPYYRRGIVVLEMKKEALEFSQVSRSLAVARCTKSRGETGGERKIRPASRPLNRVIELFKGGRPLRNRSRRGVKLRGCYPARFSRAPDARHSRKCFTARPAGCRRVHRAVERHRIDSLRVKASVGMRGLSRAPVRPR